MQGLDKKKIYVAMSGGVDSSVAAALLKEQGHDITGVFFKPWQPEEGGAFCNWQEDRQDALRVATTLGIPFKTWDFSKEYGDAVTSYMIQAYKAGITPNPDVMCNKEIKFGIFLKKALEEGVDLVATGHYARVHHNEGADEYELLTAKDDNKDQTYFLYTLTQTQLSRALFPVGGYTKPEIRELAKKYNLGTHDKKDSQGVCFVGQLNMKEFLSQYIKPQKGKVILLEMNEEIGTHDGVAYYTIGQRHGLDLGKDGGPYYVAKKDIEKNIIYVTTEEQALEAKELTANMLSWTNTPIISGTHIHAKIRYRTPAISATFTQNDNGSATVVFDEPVRAVTSGQSIVFYDNEKVLGGGIII